MPSSAKSPVYSSRSNSKPFSSPYSSPYSSSSSKTNNKSNNSLNNENKIQSPSPPPSAPILQTKINQESGGLFSNVLDGFSFGFGSSIARRVVGGVFDKPNTNTNTNTNNNTSTNTSIIQTPIKIDNTILDYTNKNYKPNPACELLYEELINCTNTNSYDCSMSLKLFKECEDNQKYH